MKTATTNPVMTATNGNQYMINLSQQAKDKAQLQGIQAQFYDLLRTMHPDRLENLKVDGKLEEYLNSKAEQFHKQMETRLMNLEEREKFTQIPLIQSQVISEILDQEN